ncbi:hypothetical protein V6N13_070266 [Hibiscus sabdariffa]
MAKVPVIDFSKKGMKPGSPEWDLVKFQVREAVEAYGCFEALAEQVLEVRQPVFGALEQLFDLPLQTKKLCVSNKPFRGYSVSSSGLFESMSVDDAHIAENVERCLNTSFWPQGNTNISETLVSFIQLASGLEKTVLRMILESFGVEKYTDELSESTNYQLRAMKYGKPKPCSDPTLGIVAHCDQNLMTLLYQNEVNGLEIENKVGEWISIRPSLHSFVVIIGETLSVWLNGALSSPCHRVMIKENKDRYSLGLFARMRGGYLAKTPKELVDDHNPMLFKPFDYEEFSKFYHAQIAQGVAASGFLRSGLKSYCTL